MIPSLHLADKTGYSLEEAIKLRTASPQTIESFQTDRLKYHLRHCLQVPFYKQLYAKIDFNPETLSSLQELSRLPVTRRNHIDDNPELFGCSGFPVLSDIAITSGTTGNPVVVPYTMDDLDRLAFNEMMAFYSAGIRQGDTVLLTVTLDRCFIAGLAYYLGVVRLGAAAIRSGPGQIEKQWQLIEKLKPNSIVGVPTFLLKLAQFGKQAGFHNRTVRKLITIGEPIRDKDGRLTILGEQLEETWKAKIYSSYGATEVETAFGECELSNGGHVHPELMIVEIIDDNGTPVEPGEAGEVVVTPLGVKGFPLVRFCTGDMARLHSDPCDCGWNSPRLGAIEGRLAQRLKVRGTTLYPEAIFQALQQLPDVAESYIKVRSTFDLSDEITVHVAVGDHRLDEQTISDKLQSHLRIRPNIIIEPLDSIIAAITSDDGRKPKKFFDLR